MKTLLAALALLTGSALACTTASTVIAEGSCSTCAIQQPDQPAIPQTPEDSCNNCAIPTPPAQKLRRKLQQLRRRSAKRCHPVRAEGQLQHLRHHDTAITAAGRKLQ